MTERHEDDLSPTLGGDRASDPAPEPQAAPQEELPPQTNYRLSDMVAELFQQAGAPELAQLLGGFDGLDRQVETLIDSTTRLIEEHLPPAVAAFEGLFQAVEEALEPMLREEQDE